MLPLFYGPYYVHIANGMSGDIAAEGTNMIFALSLSVMTSMIMTGVFNIVMALEDPFTEDGLDDLRVNEVFSRIQDALDIALDSS